MKLTFLQVALGGALGATARYAVNVAVGRLMPGFPLATLLINVSGSFLMGLVVTLLALRGGQHLAPFLMTGILGGFTTFSAFSLDTMTLWQRGQGSLAVTYVALSVGASLVAIIAGMAFGRTVFA
ncbi:fluoride efflux transporter CrcB [Paracoccus aminophilus]|uniref:Fluoride-specific ion channel FluC n=1 Tax=Paracoccus aminophilus JCM 7686 TaxID=1367847 RepID=S5Y388_PARAH|nr:fluoride efflux transporter CrcB [Paracoccus aminophilus]AGT10215.1 camphor resistance protein CrcB [Paracoccus aminophilus JCM 7686]